MSPVKEVHFFGTDLIAPQFCRDERQYLSLFSDARNEKRVGEASVWYLYSEQAAAEIKKFNSQARIIIMLRNPVEMMHSLHSQLLYMGAEDIADFEAALDAEKDRKQGLRIPKRIALVQQLFYREAGKYTEQVRRYLNVFGRENVHIIVYDDFKSDTAGAYKETLRFLGVSSDSQVDFPVVNPNERVRSEAVQDLARRLFIALPWQVRARLRKSPIINRIYKYNSRHETRRPIDPELSKHLQAEFAPEVERLGELLGRDLTGWK